jgi:hypothetical protein
MRSLHFYIVLLLACCLPNTAFAVEAEYQVKAAMLFNFAKFVEWPAGTLSSDNKLHLCVAGRSGMIEALQQLQGKLIKGRTFTVRQINRPEESSGCNILYIPQSESGRSALYLQQAGTLSILTVSSLQQFASAGGMIGFYDEEGKVRFEINPEAAKKGKLQISSHLLKLARIAR